MADGRGGKREGAGRPKGAGHRALPEQKAALSELAREHTQTALNALVAVASRGESEAARVAAATALLDRGYGRPKQLTELTGKDGGPVQFSDARAMLLDRIAGLAAREAEVDGSSRTH